MTTTHIVGGKLQTREGFKAGTVSITGDAITSICDDGAVEGTAEIIVEASGLIVAPGFIDIQINGGFGIDLQSEPDAIWDLGTKLPRHGVTAFLPTIITCPPPTRRDALAALRDRPGGYLGAEPLGFHFEGPMLSPLRPGAHQVEHLVMPDLDVIEDWSRDNGVLMVTVAPELPGALEVIAQLVSRDVTVAAGHSDASSAEAIAGIDAGCSAVTHLFNAMAPLEHRNPNLIGVSLADSGIIAGLIVDGVHVEPIAVAVAWNAKGPDGIALITDAVAPMGREPGTYSFAGHGITADATSVRNRDGVLAGSILTMDRAVRNLVEYTGCQTHHALTSASTTPATAIGATHRGHISEGAIADLVLLDQHLQVQITVCAGQVAYVADTATDRTVVDS
jgi:N-acetylglucosamine-6-phosphate deacetylase